MLKNISKVFYCHFENFWKKLRELVSMAFTFPFPTIRYTVRQYYRFNRFYTFQ